MSRLFLVLGSSFGFLSVALGAFAAHGLKEKLDENSLKIFRLGVEYQFYHAFALLFVGLCLSRAESGMIRNAGYCFTVGILIFSGSLYALAGTQIKVLGAITPIGGTLFLVGWAMLVYGFWKGA